MSDSRSHHNSFGVDFEACPCSGRTLSKLLQPAIMTLLATEPLHGYCIVSRLAEMPTLGGSPPDSTGVYRMLKFMEEHSFVDCSWETPDSGPARKTYRLTATGYRCLERWIDTLEGYHRAIGSLLASAREAGERGRRHEA